VSESRVLRVAEKFDKSDAGLQRRTNEDRVFARPPLFAVADGMGGARAGEVASALVVDVLEDGLPDGGSPEERLADRAQEANRRIHELAQSEASRAGMGTTLTAAFVGEDAVSVAHVGDSRAYRLRDGELELVTHDHSLVGELVRRGKLTEQEAEEHPQRSVITRALGPEAVVDVDTWSFPAQAGDVFLLCSDGLTSMVDGERIRELLEQHTELRAAGQALIDEANERGGRDNISVVLFRLEDVPTGQDTDQPTEVGMKAPSREQIAAAEAQAATAETSAQAQPVAAAAAEPAEPPRRTMPLPTRPSQPASRPRRRPRLRWLRPVLVVAAIAFLVLAGAWTATRAVYFVGTDEDGFVTVYQGLPFDGPLGIKLYADAYVSAVPASEIRPSRRAVILDHRLRSQADASDLVRKLELGQVGS
jgi:protein phosphatase